MSQHFIVCTKQLNYNVGGERAFISPQLNLPLAANLSAARFAAAKVEHTLSGPVRPVFASFVRTRQGLLVDVVLSIKATFVVFGDLAVYTIFDIESSYGFIK
jgi:hypothetical protein